MAMSRALAGRSVTSRPSMAMAPSLTCSSPAMIRSSVDFPQPDGPTSTRNSPSAMASSISCSTCTLPKAFATLSIAIVAMRTPSQMPHHSTPSAPTQRASMKPDRNRQVSVPPDQWPRAPGEEDWAQRRTRESLAAPSSRRSGPYRRRQQGGYRDGEDESNDPPAVHARRRPHRAARRRRDAVSGTVREGRRSRRDQSLELALGLGRRGLAEDDRQLQ